MRVPSRIDGSICGALPLLQHHRPSLSSNRSASPVTTPATAATASLPIPAGSVGYNPGGAWVSPGFHGQYGHTRSTRGFGSISSVLLGDKSKPSNCHRQRHRHTARASPTSGPNHRSLLSLPALRVTLPQRHSHAHAHFSSPFGPSAFGPYATHTAAAVECPPPSSDFNHEIPYPTYHETRETRETHETHETTPTTPTTTPDPPPRRKRRRQTQNLTKQELLDLIEPYDDEEIGPVDEYLQYIRDPYMRGYAQPDTQHFTFVRSTEDHDYPNLDQVISPREEDQKALWELRFAVLTRLRSPHKIALDRLYDIYRRVPEPRMLYIHARLRHQFLRALGQPTSQHRDPASMLRYFEVIADVKNTGIPLTTAEWNCTIAFASRYVGAVRETEVEASLKLWREMEVDAGIQANNVTFNILFDVACKAGNFVLAEMIYREMESRGHYYNRYHYTSLIHFFGLKHETSGVRAAFREMVLAGEMIDTVVLNAVIGGLLRSGEEGPAEKLYARMKEVTLGEVGAESSPESSAETNDGNDDYGNNNDGNSDIDNTENSTTNSNTTTTTSNIGTPSSIPIRTPTSDRAVTQALLMFAKIARRHPSSHATLQRLTPLTPDIQTYRILVNHYGVKRGNLARAASYIDEMKFFHIPLHHAIFLALFKGFATHGGVPRSAWSEKRLLGIWNALLDALDGGHAEGVEIRMWLAVWALRAFAKCSGRERVLAVYDALKARWVLGEREEMWMVEFLGGIVGRR
ncbi:hypothetical protein B0J18DRAFT_430767 [Chaetomium sp. MPI-SDFR-AT-0129]|nr:hypothetical protein B0J18DRAFT_430767 [Chaetomium sp. MPI-SDFR-AT-0129]